MDVIEVTLAVVGTQAQLGGVVTQLRVFVVPVGHVQPKAVHAPIEPEADDVPERLAHFWIAPVEVWLLREKEMQVILARGLVPCPGRSTKDRLPVVGRLPWGAAVAPDVPIPLGVVSTGAGLGKPVMLVRGMVEHQVHDHPNVALVGLAHQFVKVFQRAKERVNVAIVADIVTKVIGRRGIDRREPDGIHTQRVWRTIVEIIQVGDDATQVAHAVAVCIDKAARIDLVNYALPPPEPVRRGIMGHDTPPCPFKDEGS